MPSATLRRPAAPVLLLALVAAWCLVDVAPAEAAPRERTDAELVAERVALQLHHDARRDPGAFGHPGPSVPAVRGWTDLRDVARAWSDRQAADGQLRHNPAFPDQVCCWRSVGENVGTTTLPALDDATVTRAVRAVFQAWMDSAGHRENVLAGADDHVGIGASVRHEADRYVLYLTANHRDADGTPPGEAYGPPPATTTPPPYDTPACPHGEYPRGVFADTTSGTHAGAIDCMVWWDVVRRTDAPAGDDRYRPGEVASRGLMAALVARTAAAAGHPLPAGDDRFADDDGHPHEAAIDAVAAAGIAGGFADGTFRPDAALTRAQMATFLARLYVDWLGFPRPAPADHFVDDDRDPHREAIDVVASAGIATGTGDRRFSPGDALTRGQLASFAARVADHLARAGTTPS